ncbi:unnamed protein product [Pylaiella littoralis]
MMRKPELGRLLRDIEASAPEGLHNRVFDNAPRTPGSRRATEANNAMVYHHGKMVKKAVVKGKKGGPRANFALTAGDTVVGAMAREEAAKEAHDAATTDEQKAAAKEKLNVATRKRKRTVKARDDQSTGGAASSGVDCNQVGAGRTSPALRASDSTRRAMALLRSWRRGSTPTRAPSGKVLLSVVDRSSARMGT